MPRLPTTPNSPGHCSSAALLTLLLLSCLLSSCQYFVDRGADFLDQYRLSVGLGSVVGVRKQALGVYDTGLMFGVKPNAAALGWRYGKPLYFDNRDQRLDVDQAEIIKTTHVSNMDLGAGSYDSAKNSAAVLPALLTWTDSTPTDFQWQVPEEGEDFEDRHWLWSSATFEQNRYAQIHAFDIEAEVGLFVYLEAGYSPGELIDFLLGLVTIDIAEDDGRF